MQRNMDPSQLKKTITDYLDRFPDNPEKKEVADFLRVNTFGIYPYKMLHFPYAFPLDYQADDIQIYFSAENSKYVMFEGKKLFFPSSMSDHMIKENYTSLLIEQDKRSPHCYSSKPKFIPGYGEIIADMGAAEGIWALSVIEKCKKAYLFECDENWIDALKLTFAPWGDKVVIVNKFIGGVDDGDQVTLDTYFADKEIDCIKADIEGAEIPMLTGGAKTLSHKVSKVLLCAYHNQDDEVTIRGYLAKYGFEEIETTDRYLLFLYHGTTIAPPYVRRALVLGCKTQMEKKLSEFHAHSHSIGDFFEDGARIGLLTADIDSSRAKLFMDELNRDRMFQLKYLTPDEIAGSEERQSLDYIVVLDDDAESKAASGAYGKTNGEIVYLSDIIDVLHDCYFLFEPLAKALGRAGIKDRTIVLGWCDFGRLYGDFEAAEGRITRPPSTHEELLAMYHGITENTLQYIDEVFVREATAGKFVKMVDGLRNTSGQPAFYDATIHFVGGGEIWGIGADDKHTLPSCVQELLHEKVKRYRVLNHGTPKSADGYESVCAFIQSIQEGKVSGNDIVVLSVKPNFHQTKWKKQRKISKYVAEYIGQIGLRYLDLAPALRKGQDKDQIYANDKYLNPKGYRFLASILYFECLRNYAMDGDGKL